MMKNRIIRDTILLTIMQLILDSAALFLNGFITRSLGASAIGIFSLMGSFLGLAGIISNGNAFLCTSRLISEELGKNNGNPNKILFHGIKLCTILSLGVSAIILLFANPIGKSFFGGEEGSFLLKFMPVSLITGAISCCFKGYFNACRKSSYVAFTDVAEFIVRAAVIVIMTTFSVNNNESAVCRIMITSVIAGNVTALIFMLVLFSLKRIRGQGRGTLSFRQYISFAFPIMGGSILTSVLSSTNDALVPFCLKQYGDSTEQALALFGIFEAIVIPTLFFPSVVLCSISGIVVTESARATAAGNSERIQIIASRLIRYTIIYGVFASAVLIRFGRPIGELCGGGETGGNMISAIAPVVPFIYMEIILEAMIKGMGLQAFSSLNYLAEYVIRISIVLVTVPQIGFAGIALSYYASNIIGNTLRLIKLIRHTKVKFRLFSMLLSPIIYAFLTMSVSDIIFRLFSITCGNAFTISLYLIIWLTLFGGVYILSHILTSVENKKLFIVHN
ncbi:MAG: oligosaccharide flippase family protein [Ruminococcus sp.]|nr:oligosaccharide flippase family protein [Ruminococcus sp.]